MTINSQLSTNLKKNKLSKQLQQEQNHRNGDHKQNYQQGSGRGRMGGKGTGNKKQNWQVENTQGEIKNSIGNGEAKELICTTQGHELRVGLQVEWWCRAKDNTVGKMGQLQSIKYN